MSSIMKIILIHRSPEMVLNTSRSAQATTLRTITLKRKQRTTGFQFFGLLISKIPRASFYNVYLNPYNFISPQFFLSSFILSFNKHLNESKFLLSLSWTLQIQWNKTQFLTLRNSSSSPKSRNGNKEK